MKPYTDIEITDKYIIREFNENIDPISYSTVIKAEGMEVTGSLDEFYFGYIRDGYDEKNN
jgi:hypothetical protein